MLLSWPGCWSKYLLKRMLLFSFVSLVIYMQVRFCQQNVVHNGVESATGARKGGRVNAHHAPHWTLMEKLDQPNRHSGTWTGTLILILIETDGGCFHFHAQQLQMKLGLKSALKQCFLFMALMADTYELVLVSSYELAQFKVIPFVWFAICCCHMLSFEFPLGAARVWSVGVTWITSELLIETPHVDTLLNDGTFHISHFIIRRYILHV